MADGNWSWIWPSVGGTPINQGLDSEMFDRDDYPYSETFVREAIQNSLDARDDEDKPVFVRFTFHNERLAKRSRFLSQAIKHRKEAGLSVPELWESDRISWIVVEDSNTKGLLGDLSERKGDFWGYWLNFGLSNKTGTGRGGRGIGRVTFLIASQMHSVIGLTRRHDDQKLAGCGMCVLKADQYGSDFKSTHAYLAASETGSTYQLHDSEAFHSQLVEAFQLAPYTTDPSRSGLSLIIPYPHKELDEEGILAAAVDHFSPAILNGSLIVEVGVDRLDKASFKLVAPCVAKRIKSEAISEGLDRYLSLIEAGLGKAGSAIELPAPNAKLGDHRDTPQADALRKKLVQGQTVVFDLQFPLERHGKVTPVKLRVAAAPTPYGKLPIDRLSREGMSLPNVKSRRPSDIDLVMMVDDELLAQYLNFCEGKAHLDLLDSKEVRAKLEENGFSGMAARRLVKSLPDTLREFLSEESEEPDSSVFESFFGIPDPESPGKKAPGKIDKPNIPPPPPPPPPPPNPPIVMVETLDDGFRLTGNPDYKKFPATIAVRIAYADGSNNPSWSPFDFAPTDLKTVAKNCTPTFSENKLIVSDFDAGSSIEVCGFDTRREVDTRIRAVSNASSN
jgi:hypothetical protein